MLADFMSAEQSQLLVRDPIEDLIRPAGISRVIPEMTRAYVEHFQHQDPSRRGYDAIPIGGWWIDSHKLGVQGVRASPFHQEFLRPNGMVSYMSAPIIRDGHREVALSFLRGRRAGLFTQDDADRLHWIVPHLQRAVSMRERIHELTQTQRLSESLMNRLPYGLVLVGANGNPLMHNARGRHWLEQFGPASQKSARSPATALPLNEMIRAACHVRSPTPVQACWVTRRGARVAQLIVLKLTEAHALGAGAHQTAALLVFHEPRAASRLLGGILRDLYGLSPAEIKIAEGVLELDELRLICARLRISAATMRTHLQSIFRKMGVHSRPHLVRVLSALGSFDGADD